MIKKPLSNADIGKHIIYGIYHPDINKSYGTIISFNDDYVVCRIRNKDVQCDYQDLSWDIQPDEPFNTDMERGWDDLMKRFEAQTIKRLNSDK